MGRSPSRPALLALAVTGSGVARADPWRFGGASPRDLAMAGAGAAGAAPGSSFAVDPGAVALLRHRHVSLALRQTGPSVDLEGDAFLVDPVFALQLSAAAGRGNPDRFHLGWGVTTYQPLPDMLETRTNTSEQGPTAPFLDDAWDRAEVLIALGPAFGELGLAAGVALGIDVVADTEVLVLEPVGMGNDERTDITDTSRVDQSRRLSWSPAPMVGLHYAGEKAALYLSWRGADAQEATGHYAMSYDFDLPNAIPAESDLRYCTGWTASRLAAGAARVGKGVRPEAMVGWERTSAWVDARMEPPDPPLLDVVSGAVGVEADLRTDLLGRAGYAFHPTPLPSAAAGLADAGRHVIAGGLAWKAWDPPPPASRLEVAAGAQVHLLERRSASGEDGDLQGQIAVFTASVSSGF